MRRPVIVSRVGGVPEIVRENLSGWSIDNNRIYEWVEKIRRVTTDDRLKRRLGDYGRRWVSETFGWKAIASQVESLLREEVDDQ